MAFILPVIACCAVITIALGIVAVMGLSRRDKNSVTHDEAITQQRRR